MRYVSLGLLVAGLLALGGGVVGQDKKDTKDDPKAKAGQLPQGWGKANLGLSDDQKKKITDIDSKADTEVEALKKKIKEIEKKKHDDQVAVLTDEQKKKLDDYFKSKGSGKDK